MSAFRKFESFPAAVIDLFLGSPASARMLSFLQRKVIRWLDAQPYRPIIAATVFEMDGSIIKAPGGETSNPTARTGSIEAYDLACAARLAFLQLDRAFHGHDLDEVELAQFTVRDVMNRAKRLNEVHGTAHH